mmetsp:Transcript_92789/g.248176  ORF Transcript_92789/g.248176 Transcript_92789/m.248176 type:complete len:111 (-) Transcript_92789:107-439(-)
MDDSGCLTARGFLHLNLAWDPGDLTSWISINRFCQGGAVLPQTWEMMADLALKVELVATGVVTTSARGVSKRPTTATTDSGSRNAGRTVKTVEKVGLWVVVMTGAWRRTS